MTTENIQIFVASMIVKSPCGSFRSTAKPFSIKTCGRFDSLLPLLSSSVATAIKSEPRIDRHLLASVIYSGQFLPISDNERPTISTPRHLCNGTGLLYHTQSLSRQWPHDQNSSPLNTLFLSSA